jgi:EAL domain-containing protein (putative c-di-GMP-specific phosphodiesterase class I)
MLKGDRNPMLQDIAVKGETTARDAGAPSADARRLRQELRHAVQTGGFALVFQPRRDLRTDAVVGGAAQLRWPRRRGGVTAASGLQKLLEAHGLAAAVAAWTLNAACAAAATWPCGLLSVTADPGALRDGTLLRDVGTALQRSGLPPERLELDFDEAALASDGAERLFTLAALRDRGVGVALDGFGAESGSLLPLKRLPLTALKLDRSLVRDVPEDRDAAAIIDLSLRFAHVLDMTMVACGVETEAQLVFLRAAGCDEAQGSLCGRAVTGDDIALRLKKQEGLIF